MNKKLTKSQILNIVLISLECLLIVLCLSLPILEKVYHDEFDKWYRNYWLVNIFNSHPLSLFHQIATVLLLLSSVSVIALSIISLFINKKIHLAFMISLTIQLLSSFFFILHFNFYGFLCEFILVATMFIIFSLNNDENKQKNNLFNNVIYGLILIILMIIIVVTDIYYI